MLDRDPIGRDGSNSIRSRMRSAIRIALSAVLPGMMITNSSPPNLAQTSKTRTDRRRISATSRRTRSPARCPYESLTILKSSMSIKSSASGNLVTAGALQFFSKPHLQISSVEHPADRIDGSRVRVRFCRVERPLAFERQRGTCGECPQRLDVRGREGRVVLFDP